MKKKSEGLVARTLTGKDAPLTVHLRVKLTLEADLEAQQLAERKLGRFVLASNELDPTKLTPQQMLARRTRRVRWSVASA